MDQPSDFDLKQFLPYLLNQAAEATSLAFQQHYKDRYGMLRTEWRVLFHLGRYGTLNAREICDRAQLHKTKVSRAVSALETKRYLSRATSQQDRRNELLTLTKSGEAVFRDLIVAARRFDESLAARFSADEVAVLRKCLGRISQL